MGDSVQPINIVSMPTASEEAERMIVCENANCKCSAPKLVDWQMYDVPVTFSVLAPRGVAAEAYVRQCLEQRLDLYTRGAAYERDHAFVDGNARLCDCQGH